jgi:hypothetical protein
VPALVAEHTVVFLQGNHRGLPLRLSDNNLIVYFPEIGYVGREKSCYQSIIPRRQIMATIQWRPESNPLTNPKSYKARILHRVTMDYAAVAEAISARNPNFSAIAVETILRELREEVRIQLNNGNAVALKDFCSFRTSANVRLETASSPMPSPGTSLMTVISASRTLRDDVRQGASYEKLPAEEKSPVITEFMNTMLGLPNVLDSNGYLAVVKGSNILIGPGIAGSKMTIEGTQSGSTVQTDFAERTPAKISFSTMIPSQAFAWNNEYTVSITTRYTENGSLRVSTYSQYLRQSMDYTIGSLPRGVLSSTTATAIVDITAYSGATQTVRLCADVNSQDDTLRIWMADMTANGEVGNSVIINDDTGYTIDGYPGALITSIGIETIDWAALKTLVKTKYAGRMYDIVRLTV